MTGTRARAYMHVHALLAPTCMHAGTHNDRMYTCIETHRAAANKAKLEGVVQKVGATLASTMQAYRMPILPYASIIPKPACGGTTMHEHTYC